MATGTADVAIMISKEIVKLEAAKPAPSGSTPSTIVGIDPSAKMLEVSRFHRRGICAGQKLPH